MALTEVKVPDIGGFNDVPVIEVLVAAGDTIAKDAPLVTLESDKATMEVPSTLAGTVKDIKVKVAQTQNLIDQLTTVTFVEQNGKTTMTMHSRAAAVAEVGVGHLQGMEIGWTQTIDRLEALLARSA